jgi:hypothetical protein
MIAFSQLTSHRRVRKHCWYKSDHCQYHKLYEETGRGPSHQPNASWPNSGPEAFPPPHMDTEAGPAGALNPQVYGSSFTPPGAPAVHVDRSIQSAVGDHFRRASLNRLGRFESMVGSSAGGPVTSEEDHPNLHRSLRITLADVDVGRRAPLPGSERKVHALDFSEQERPDEFRASATPSTFA